MRTIILIAHNLRSCHNVGSLLRTADGFGVDEVYLTGYTPFPIMPDEARLPHLAQKITRHIHKTALGAEDFVPIQHCEELDGVLARLRDAGFTIAAIEQTDNSVKLPDFKPPDKIALIVGREVEGIEPEILAACDLALEIPMFGRKESFNVAQAAAAALYHCRFLE
jgi:23S rRNA (guanosine2251-2'-O)-methyltransferase